MSNKEKNQYTLYKSSICFYKSKCKNGDKCQFAHTNEEIEPIKCWFNYQGDCENEKCKFWHKNDETKEQFYIRTEQNNKIGRKIFKLLPKISDKNNSLLTKLIPISQTNKELDDIKKSRSEEKISLNIDDYTYETFIQNKEKQEKINNIEIQNEIKTQKENPITFYTKEDNEKIDNYNEPIKIFTIIKNMYKEDFINYYNYLIELQCNILLLEKNNKTYKIIIKYDEKIVFKLLEYEEDEENNLPL